MKAVLLVEMKTREIVANGLIEDDPLESYIELLHKFDLPFAPTVGLDLRFPRANSASFYYSPDDGVDWNKVDTYPFFVLEDVFYDVGHEQFVVKAEKRYATRAELHHAARYFIYGCRFLFNGPGTRYGDGENLMFGE